MTKIDKKIYILYKVVVTKILNMQIFVRLLPANNAKLARRSLTVSLSPYKWECVGVFGANGKAQVKRKR